MTTPEGMGEGIFGLFQLINSEEIKTEDADERGALTVLSTAGKHVYDDALGLPYGGEKNIGNGETATDDWDDTPGTGLTEVSLIRLKELFRQDYFETYLMYKPKDGYWVALRQLTWSWKGRASKNGAGVWSMVPDSASPVQPGQQIASSVANDLPQAWVSNASSMRPIIR